MPNVAVAYHENIAVQEINRYFAATHATGDDSRSVTCPRCSLVFAVILINRTSNSNPAYFDDLRSVIEKDCVVGYHRGDNKLSAGSPVE